MRRVPIVADPRTDGDPEAVEHSAESTDAPGVRSTRGFDLRGRAALVVVGGFLCQLGLGFGYVFGPLAGDVIAEFGWSRAEYSGARAPQLLVLALMSPVVGFAVVRIGAHRILIASTTVLGIVFLLFSQMQELWHMYALVVLMGIALAGVGDVTVGQLVTQWVDKSRGLALGIVYTGSNLAGFVLVPYALRVASEDSWRASLGHLGLLAFLLLVPAATILARDKKVLHAGAGPGTAEDEAADGALALSEALRTRSFWILAFSLFTFFFFFLGLLDHLVLFLTDEGIPRAQAGNYFRWAVGLGVVSKILLGAIADRVHPKPAILLDFGLLAVSSGLLLLLPGPPALMWTFVVAYGFATAARDVVYPLILTRCFGSRMMAEIYGGLLLALIPGGMLGPVFAAFVHDRTGSYTVAFTTFAALNVLSVFVLAFVRDERRRPRAAA